METVAVKDNYSIFKHIFFLNLWTYQLKKLRNYSISLCRWSIQISLYWILSWKLIFFFFFYTILKSAFSHSPADCAKSCCEASWFLTLLEISEILTLDLPSVSGKVSLSPGQRLLQNQPLCMTLHDFDVSLFNWFQWSAHQAF